MTATQDVFTGTNEPTAVAPVQNTTEEEQPIKSVVIRAPHQHQGAIMRAFLEGRPYPLR